MSTTSTRPARRTIRQFVPPQHGAWAMLLLPYLAGLLVAGFRWPDLPLLCAWLAGYLLSYYVFLAVKSRRPGRYLPQFRLYGLVAVPAGAIVLAAEPRLLWFAPVYAVLLAVNAWYAWRRRERALLNDLASVAQSCLVIGVVTVIAGGRPADTWAASVLVLLYLTGTVLHVKTMIRERGSRTYRTASVGYHLAALAAVTVISIPAALVFALLTVRAWVLPGRSLTPKRVGFVEIGASVLVLAAVALVGRPPFAI
ncbi:YwiC-like family protein [Actinoplanes flavus]|uniref:YwiC-like family protein n=1 Tax=Actinoplanes flavus TaxID=2820290 RepID=UPI0027DD321C|nr:YwiC-like family protein [Actinoplanes flavus]